MEHHHNLATNIVLASLSYMALYNDKDEISSKVFCFMKYPSAFILYKLLICCCMGKWYIRVTKDEGLTPLVFLLYNKIIVCWLVCYSNSNSTCWSLLWQLESVELGLIKELISSRKGAKQME